MFMYIAVHIPAACSTTCIVIYREYDIVSYVGVMNLLHVIIQLTLRNVCLFSGVGVGKQHEDSGFIRWHHRCAEHRHDRHYDYVRGYGIFRIRQVRRQSFGQRHAQHTERGLVSII